MNSRTGKHFKNEKDRIIHDKTGRIVISWNRFARSLKEAFELYWETKQAEIASRFEELPKTIKKIPFKETSVVAIPFVGYLLIFSNYCLLRILLGLGKVTKPNHTFLPWMEILVFHCFPHQIMAKFAHPVLDCMAAMPYLLHFALPFLFAFFKVVSIGSIRGMFPYLWCAGWVNLVAAVIQLLFPTAPPWYVDSVVFSPVGEVLKTAPNEAAFHRLDASLGVPFFHGIYAASPVPFGAFPSLHVAWPAVILVSGPWINEKFAMFHVVWITWAAIYSNHHYGVDAVGGIFLVFLVNFMMRKVWCPFPLENGRKPSCHLCRRMSPPLLQV
ncbi:uncharacterized protein LOC141880275 [Acropora palmata]|uniref:uncharacterized protein LOC141880275 n=1 Tax=Acropora palmata TaxID=6131 RepID=UPI003DA15292